MDWNKYNRNALPGEDVYYFTNGRRDITPIVARCTASGGVVAELSLQRPGHSRTQCLNNVRHINDPHFRKYPEQLISDGAWDFHPVVGELWQAQLLKNDAERKRLEKMPAADEMSADEVEALSALERLGPYISKISKDTGVSPEKLKAMETFWPEFTARKQELSQQKKSPVNA